MASSSKQEIHHLAELLSSCPTSWHATSYLAKSLIGGGFERLEVAKPWKLKTKGRYFVEVGPGSLFAFVIPQKPKHLALLGCHTESPMLKIKDRGFIQEEGIWMAHVEPYGGPILSSWFFKDLGLAGRVVIEEKGSLYEELVHLDEPIGIMLSPAIHLDREMNQKGFLPDKQKHLKVLLGSQGEEHPLEKLLKRVSAKKDKKILSHELYFYPLESVRTLALDDSWLASWRIDNLASCAACLETMLAIEPSEKLAVALFADHEEIGSETYAGAASCKYRQMIGRLFESLELKSHEKAQLLDQGLLCSVDGAHGLHPCYSELYEPSHKPKLGLGPVIKYHAAARYATDARSSAKIQWHAKEAGIPMQSFQIRADMTGGSTIGPILSTSLGIEGVDIGLPQLAMHATREMMHTQDYLKLIALLKSVCTQSCPFTSHFQGI